MAHSDQTKRYQVFVSSTYKDLSEERLEVIKALLELDCFPCSMEYFPAANEDAWSYIESLISQCDYYIVIVGGRYGSLTSEGISFTQKEYEYALSKGVPSIAFLHASPENLPAKNTESTDDGKKQLRAFIDQLRKHLCKEWLTSHELGAVVSRSLTQLMKRAPRTGWIPANAVLNSEATQELLKMTQKVRELEEELKAVHAQKREISHNFADGEDLHSILFTYNPANPQGILKFKMSEIDIKWNDLFRAITQVVMPSAPYNIVEKAIFELVTRKISHNPSFRSEMHEFIKISIDNTMYAEIRTQFIALDFVTIDENLVWRLTENGKRRAIDLWAFKKT